MTREEQLEKALISIWRAFTVVVSNGGTGWQRHVEPAIYEAVKLLPKWKR